MTNAFIQMTGIYLLRAILVSGILYGYHRWFLRDRHFHHFNRFFLLGVPLLSLTLPFIHLPWGGYLWPADSSPLPFGATLQAITNGSWKETDATAGPS